jgi:hypothetical protein
LRKWLAVDAFRHLGAETNDRYAWSAQSPDGSKTVITLWQDEIHDDGTNVRVNFFDHPEVAVWSQQRGNKGRIRHLLDVWNGDRKFGVVMLRAQDPQAIPRSAAMRWPDDGLTMMLTEFDPVTGAFSAEGIRKMPSAQKGGTGWSQEELEGCVVAYHRLWLAQEASTPANKSALRREVIHRFMPSRSQAAYERRMQNISAV